MRLSYAFSAPMPNHKAYAISVLMIRLAFGFRLLYGTFDNVVSWERMLEFRDFLAANGFPFPLFCAVVSVYCQFLSGISWIMGFLVKYTSLLMIINFVVAIVGVHILHRDTYLATAPAIHLLIISIFLWLCGPGAFSLDERKKYNAWR